MDPTVTAAAIGVGGTVIVGVTGYWASVRNTSKTIEEDRGRRVWERRADVYLEALAAVKFFLYTIERDLPFKPDSISGRAQPPGEPDWYGLDARMRAFASEPVWEAMRTVREIADLLGVSSVPRPASPAKPASPASRASGEPAAAAPDIRIHLNNAAHDLIDLIRTELQSGARHISRRQQRLAQARRQYMSRDARPLNRRQRRLLKRHGVYPRYGSD